MPALPVAIATRLSSIVAYRRGLRTDSSERCKFLAPQVIGLSESEGKGADFGIFAVDNLPYHCCRGIAPAVDPRRNWLENALTHEAALLCPNTATGDFHCHSHGQFCRQSAFQNVNAVRLVLNEPS